MNVASHIRRASLAVARLTVSRPDITAVSSASSTGDGGRLRRWAARGARWRGVCGPRDRMRASSPSGPPPKNTCWRKSAPEPHPISGPRSSVTLSRGIARSGPDNSICCAVGVTVRQPPANDRQGEAVRTFVRHYINYTKGVYPRLHNYTGAGIPPPRSHSATGERHRRQSSGQLVGRAGSVSARTSVGRA